VEGSRVTGEGTYAAASGGLQARLDLRPFVAGPLLERAGYARLPFEVKAESAGLSAMPSLAGSAGAGTGDARAPAASGARTPRSPGFSSACRPEQYKIVSDA